MPFRFQWDTPEKTIIRYSAEGAWNWADFHRVLRVSYVNFDQLPGEHSIEAIIDLARSARMPVGAVGHLRSLASMTHRRRTGRFILIGVDAATQAAMGAQDGVYTVGAMTLLFVDAEAAAQAALES